MFVAQPCSLPQWIQTRARGTQQVHAAVSPDPREEGLQVCVSIAATEEMPRLLEPEQNEVRVEAITGDGVAWTLEAEEHWSAGRQLRHRPLRHRPLRLRLPKIRLVDDGPGLCLTVEELKPVQIGVGHEGLHVRLDLKMRLLGEGH